MKEKVVLAYSGGLDTTAIIPWLKEKDVYKRQLQQQAVCQTSVQDMYAVYTITDSGSTVI